MLWGLSIVLSFVLLLPNTPWLCARKCYGDIKMSPQLRWSHTLTQLWGHPCPHNSATANPQIHTHTLHMALVEYLIVFSFVTKMWPNYRISLVGYHCSIEFPCGVPLFYCCKYPILYTGTHSHTHTHVQKTGDRWLLHTCTCTLGTLNRK